MMTQDQQNRAARIQLRERGVSEERIALLDAEAKAWTGEVPDLAQAQDYMDASAEAADVAERPLLFAPRQHLNQNAQEVTLCDLPFLLLDLTEPVYDHRDGFDHRLGMHPRCTTCADRADALQNG